MKKEYRIYKEVNLFIGRKTYLKVNFIRLEPIYFAHLSITSVRDIFWYILCKHKYQEKTSLFSFDISQIKSKEMHGKA